MVEIEGQINGLQDELDQLRERDRRAFQTNILVIQLKVVEHLWALATWSSRVAF
jgi:hypothetical protein